MEVGWRDIEVSVAAACLTAQETQWAQLQLP